MCAVRRVGAQTFPLLAVISLLVTGCASMGNTLAQQLAQEAWDKCRAEGRIPLQVQFDRIEPNGTIHWHGNAGSSGFAEAQNCIQEKYRAGTLLAGKRASISPATTSGAPPVWKRGDEWAFRWESSASKGTYVWSVDREEMIEGVSHYVIKQGTREIFYRTADLAHTRETVNGAVVRHHTPSRIRYLWPLEVGKTWEQAFREDRPVDRQTNERAETASVEAEETIAVPAGTFRTMKIVYRNKGTGAIRYEEWYSPDLKMSVQIRERLDSGLQVRELIAYTLK